MCQEWGAENRSRQADGRDGLNVPFLVPPEMGVPSEVGWGCSQASPSCAIVAASPSCEPQQPRRLHAAPGGPGRRALVARQPGNLWGERAQCWWRWPEPTLQAPGGGHSRLHLSCLAKKLFIILLFIKLNCYFWLIWWKPSLLGKPLSFCCLLEILFSLSGL